MSAGAPCRRVGLYCRVSTTGQTAANQLLALRAFATARGWTVTEFVDHGVSGAKEKRPALDAHLGCAGMLAAKMIWDFSRIDYIILRNFGKLR